MRRLENGCDTRLFYDLTAAKMAEHWYGDDSMMPSLREFLSLLPQRPRVLDLACGAGYESMRLAGEGAEVVGVDFSPECIRLARERNPDIRFEQADFFALDPGLGIFDGVLAAACVIHVAHDQLAAFSGSIAAMLRPNGLAAVVYRPGSGASDTEVEVQGHKLRRVIHRYTREDLTTAFTEVGMRHLRPGYLDPGLVKDGWLLDYFHRM